MKKFLLATAVFLSLSGQVFAQNMVPDESEQSEAPKISPTLQKIIEDNRHVSVCMAAWGTLAKMDSATGLSLIDNPATVDLGTKFLNDSKLDIAKLSAALELATIVFPARVKAAGRDDVNDAVVASTTIKMYSKTMEELFAAFDADLHKNYRGIARMREESIKCDAFLASLGDFKVETPASVNLNNIRSGNN